MLDRLLQFRSGEASKSILGEHWTLALPHHLTLPFTSACDHRCSRKRAKPCTGSVERHLTFVVLSGSLKEHSMRFLASRRFTV